MQKTRIFALIALAFLSVLLVQTVSASLWEPQYQTYKLGSSAYSNGAYSSTSTYEKTTVENQDRFSSDKTVTIKKTESESYTPARTTSSRSYYDYDYDDYGHRYNDNLGYGRTTTKYNDVFIYNDGIAYPSTNWRYKEVYHDYDYPNENSYGYDYYYAPNYDWHQQIYNWRY